MGSPMSFPVLCIANLAATLVGLNRDTDSDVEKVFSRQSEMAVNGDDIAFVCTQPLYQRWKKVVSMVGLTPSLGKNYTSKKFCIINSEFRTRKPMGTWKTIPFVNLSLLLGQEKKGQDAGVDMRDKMHWWDLGPRATSLVQGMKNSEAEQVLSFFIARHKQILAKVPAKCSWFLPRSLLGAGLPALERGRSQITDENLKVAAWISCLDKEKQVEVTSRPALGDKSWYAKFVGQVENTVAKDLGGRVWAPKEYNRSKRGPLGNSFLLASLLEEIVYGDLPEEFCLETIGPELWSKKTGRVLPEREQIELKRENSAFLKQTKACIAFDYKLRAARTAAFHCSLEPMSLDKALAYHMHEELVVPWDKVHYPRSRRFVSDQPSLARGGRLMSCEEFTLTIPAKSDEKLL